MLKMKNSSALTGRHVPWVALLILLLLILGLDCQLTAGQKKVAVDSDMVLAVAYSPDGRMLAGCGFDKAIRIWDARTAKVLLLLEGPKRTRRRSIAFSPDGQTLAGSGDDGVIHLWNVRTGTLESSFPLPGWVPSTQFMHSIAFSPDGQMLAVASGVIARQEYVANEVTLVDLKTGKVRWTKAKAKAKAEGKSVYSVSVVFSPDGRTLAAAGGEVHLLDSETGGLIKSLAVKDLRALCVAFSPDGKSLAVAGGHSVAVDGGSRQIGEVFMWGVQTGQLLRKLTDLHSSVGSIAFSPDGNILATGTIGPILQKGGISYESSEIRLWDPQTGRLLRRIPGELSQVSSLTFSPDGKSLLSCDGEVVALTETLTGLRRLELMKRPLIPFSPEK